MNKIEKIARIFNVATTINNNNNITFTAFEFENKLCISFHCENLNDLEKIINTYELEKYVSCRRYDKTSKHTADFEFNVK